MKRLSEIMKKILVTMLLKPEYEWWKASQLAHYAKPLATAHGYIYDRSFYRTLTMLHKNGLLLKEKRYGPWKGRRVYKLSEDGRTQALKIKKEVTEFFNSWAKVLKLEGEE